MPGTIAQEKWDEVVPGLERLGIIDAIENLCALNVEARVISILHNVETALS